MPRTRADGPGRERTRAEHEALLGREGYELVRDTPVPGVMPYRVLEFQRVRVARRRRLARLSCQPMAVPNRCPMP